MTPTPAITGVSVNPCTSLGQFSKLCELNSSNLGAIIGAAVSFILVIAVVITLFYIIWHGIRWIASGGDKQKVDGARSGLIAAIIGLIIAFSAFFILSFALSFFGLSFSNLVLPIIPTK